MWKWSDVMKAHSIFVEEKTVYRCTCNAEFEDIKRAEAHLRHPPQEKAKSPKPKKHAPRRREPTTSLQLPSLEIPDSGQQGHPSGSLRPAFAGGIPTYRPDAC